VVRQAQTLSEAGVLKAAIKEFWHQQQPRQFVAAPIGSAVRKWKTGGETLSSSG
jgi:hypothetical protein